MTFERWKQDNRIPLALIALISLLCILYLYDLVTDFNITEPPKALTTSRLEPISNLSQWHIFGAYNNNLANLPETQLQLTLQGVMLSLSNQSTSYAIIASPSHPAKAYKVGDTLPGDAILKKILKHEIVISYQGVLQSLKLPVAQLTFDTPTN